MHNHDDRGDLLQALQSIIYQLSQPILYFNRAIFASISLGHHFLMRDARPWVVNGGLNLYGHGRATTVQCLGVTLAVNGHPVRSQLLKVWWRGCCQSERKVPP